MEKESHPSARTVSQPVSACTFTTKTGSQLDLPMECDKILGLKPPKSCLLHSSDSHERSHGDRRSSDSPCRSSATTRMSNSIGGDSTSPNMVTMNWDFDSSTPKRLAWISPMAAKIAHVLAIEEHRIERFFLWWHFTEKPERHKCLARIVDSSWFNFVSLVVIVVNTIMISIATDLSMENALRGSQADIFTDGTSGLVIEAIFTLWYTTEVLLKLFVHPSLFCHGEDGKWNIFDTILVAFSLFDLVMESTTNPAVQGGQSRPKLSHLRTLRILKLARILRVLRIVRSVHELRLLMECILNSLHNLVWCILLMGLFLYMFAVVLVQGVTSYIHEQEGNIPENYQYILSKFHTVSSGAVSLFMATSNGIEWHIHYDFLGEAGWIYRWVFVFYVLFFTIAVWNIVLSTFVEKAFRLAVPDLEETVMQRRQENLQYAEELTVLLSAGFDENHDGDISFDEFYARMKDPRVRNFFEARDLDVKDVELFFTMLAAVYDSKQVKIETFVSTCLKLRGVASNVDLQSLHFDVRRHSIKQERKLKKLETILAKMNHSLSSLLQPADLENINESHDEASDDIDFRFAL